MPSKTQSPFTSSAFAPKHADTSWGKPKFHASAKGKKRPTSPLLSQRTQKRQAWYSTAVDRQKHYLQPHWAPKPKTTTEAPLDKGYGGDSYRKQDFVHKNAPNKHLHDLLLEDDRNMLGLVPRIAVPDSAYDLRKYDAYITKMHKTLPKYQAYRHGNGKYAPFNYGASKAHDLGLCFTTFCTIDRCEMGIKCAWRHHPLTKAEREWILLSGRHNARLFLENLAKFWAVPEVPVPGASMHDK